MTKLCNNPEEHITPTNGGPKGGMLVYVKGIDGRNLMPCTPSKARKLLRGGKAKAVKRVPFTIQLLFECENQVQPVTVGVDKGAKITGFACVGNGKLLMSGEIHHRKDIKKKMDNRRICRRARRLRKWYREVRFDNRASSRRAGRIPPSIKANVEEVVRSIQKLPLPIFHIEIEDVQIDIARLNDLNLKGKSYQESNRLDENLRLATLMRDGFKCTQCKKKDTQLQAHHIVWQSEGGKDTIENLVTLCKPCHEKVHKGALVLNLRGVGKFKDVMAQRTMQGKTHMYSEISKDFSLGKVFGYETSAYRKALGLPKSHVIDALCVATLRTGEVVRCSTNNQYWVSFRTRQNRKRYWKLPRKGKGRIKYQVNETLMGFRKGDIVEVRGFLKRVVGICSRGHLAFPRVKGEPSTIVPSNCKLVEKCPSLEWGYAA